MLAGIAFVVFGCVAAELPDSENFVLRTDACSTSWQFHLAGDGWSGVPSLSVALGQTLAIGNSDRKSAEEKERKGKARGKDKKSRGNPSQPSGASAGQRAQDL